MRRGDAKAFGQMLEISNRVGVMQAENEQLQRHNTFLEKQNKLLIEQIVNIKQLQCTPEAEKKILWTTEK